MEKLYRHLIERFPEQTDIIRTLAESSARFKDLLGDHHEVCEELSKTKLADQEAEFGRTDELIRRKVNLEEELMLLMQGHQRV